MMKEKREHLDPALSVLLQEINITILNMLACARNYFFKTGLSFFVVLFFCKMLFVKNNGVSLS